VDISKYIGIPYQSHGRSFDGCDCYGLARLVLKEEFGKTLPDIWNYTSAGHLPSVTRAFKENAPILADRVKTPKPGDVILYRFFGYTSHMGVYVGDGKVLHITANTHSVCVPVDSGILRGRREGYYEIR